MIVLGWLFEYQQFAERVLCHQRQQICTWAKWLHSSGITARVLNMYIINVQNVRVFLEQNTQTQKNGIPVDMYNSSYCNRWVWGGGGLK